MKKDKKKIKQKTKKSSKLKALMFHLLVSIHLFSAEIIIGF